MSEAGIGTIKLSGLFQKVPAVVDYVACPRYTDTALDWRDTIVQLDVMI
jgi:hypothetical protein